MRSNRQFEELANSHLYPMSLCPHLDQRLPVYPKVTVYHAGAQTVTPLNAGQKPSDTLRR